MLIVKFIQNFLKKKMSETCLKQNGYFVYLCKPGRTRRRIYNVSTDAIKKTIQPSDKILEEKDKEKRIWIGLCFSER